MTILFGDYLKNKKNLFENTKIVYLVSWWLCDSMMKQLNWINTDVIPNTEYEALNK